MAVVRGYDLVLAASQSLAGPTDWYSDIVDTAGYGMVVVRYTIGVNTHAGVVVFLAGNQPDVTKMLARFALSNSNAANNTGTSNITNGSSVDSSFIALDLPERFVALRYAYTSGTGAIDAQISCKP